MAYKYMIYCILFTLTSSILQFAHAGRVNISLPSGVKVGDDAELTCKFNLDGLCPSCFSVFWEAPFNMYVYNPYTGGRKSSGVPGFIIGDTSIVRGTERPDNLDYVQKVVLKKVTKDTERQICCRVMGGAQWEDTDCANLNVAD